MSAHPVDVDTVCTIVLDTGEEYPGCTEIRFDPRYRPTMLRFRTREGKRIRTVIPFIIVEE